MKSNLFLLSCLLAPAYLHAHGPNGIQTVECTLPDVVAAWRNPTGSLEGQTDIVAPSRSGEAGIPYRVSLQPCASKYCEPGTWAGLFPIFIPRDGRYRVAVDDMSAWVDVFSAFGKNDGLMCEHAGCAPIRKIVQFELKAGQQWVQLVTRKPTELGFLVVPVVGGKGSLNDAIR